MNTQQTVQYAVMCLQALDENAGKPMSLQEISQRQGVPMAECQDIVRHLSEAGIVTLAGPGRVVLLRPVEELTALEILEAVWSSSNPPPAFRMLVGGSRGARLKTTLQIVARAQSESESDSING